jgi:hypothetical protein
MHASSKRNPRLLRPALGFARGWLASVGLDRIFGSGLKERAPQRTFRAVPAKFKTATS